jgi:2-haloacid dehalogenase
VISGLILAAGTSSRLGRTKQLLELHGRPLLQFVIDAAAGAGLGEVVVVLGHEAERVGAALWLPPGARTVINRDYDQGQSTSLRTGLDALSARSEAAVVLLGDQPGISSDMIRTTVSRFRLGDAPVVRGSHGDVPGHPVVVGRDEWGEWRSLSGDAGARVLIESHPERVAEVDLGPAAIVDVDTQADYENLIRKEHTVAQDDTPTVAFDVIGTLFSLESLRGELTAHGLPPEALEVWFAESLKEYFALSHSGGYAPFKDVIAAALARLLQAFDLDPDAAAEIMPALGRLSPVPGADRCCATLSDAGCRLIALTNGGEEVTRSLLDGGGILERFDAIHSCDSIKVSKPHPDVYALARGEAAGELWMVAAHAWDVAGAQRAGLKTAWIAAKEGRHLDVYPAPDITAPDLESAAEQIVARLANSPQASS